MGQGGEGLGREGRIGGSRSLFARATFDVVAQGGRLTGLGVLADGTVVFSAAPVSEAETWALMAVGLGALGWAARRRRPLQSSAKSE